MIYIVEKRNEDKKLKNIILTFLIAFVVGCTSLNEPKPFEKNTTTQEGNTQTNLSSSGKIVSIKALKGNLTELSQRLDKIHPDPGFTMDVSEIKSQIESLSNGITSPMTHYEAWKYFAQLNPYFKDGHMLIASPQLDAQFKSHIQNGGRLFPFDVMIDSSQRLLVAETLEGYSEIKIGDEITSVNGVGASKIIETMLARMYGDSLEFRTAFTASRFKKMYWLLFGSSKNYQIEIMHEDERKQFSIMGVSEDPENHNADVREFVQSRILDNGIGYLRVDRFFYSQEQEQPFFKFLDETWQAFKDNNVKDVIIDVRHNPGGTDHYWQQGIAPFIASKPFPFLSNFKIRMTERNIKLGPIRGKQGEIIEGIFNQLVPVDAHKGLKIPGRAYLLMGPLSYSSTILFLTSLQDSKQAVIAGHSNVRSCTTGRIETHVLPGSNLELTMPTLIFTRPSGKEHCQQPIEPDVYLSNEVVNSNEAVEYLAKYITANRQTTIKTLQ